MSLEEWGKKVFVYDAVLLYLSLRLSYFDCLFLNKTYSGPGIVLVVNRRALLTFCNICIIRSVLDKFIIVKPGIYRTRVGNHLNILTQLCPFYDLKFS